jgi:signal transduction histidine kinase
MLSIKDSYKRKIVDINMPPPPIPQSEQARLAALYRYQILDTPPEAAFQAIAVLAARLTGAPIALISFVDANRQWFKARVGLGEQEMDRCISFCGYTILADDVLEVSDALVDNRFFDNPLVLNPPGIRYYAGAPIVTREKLILGSICVIDTVPRQPLSMEDRQALRDLAALVVDQLELRVAFKERAEFFANLTHEIRGPLQAVVGYVDMIHSRTLGEISPPRYSEYVDRIHFACNHVVDVISEFLDFFKYEAGYLLLKETTFDVKAVLDECVGMVKALISSSGLTLEVSIERADQELVADRQRIRQILLNLLVNAVKFTPRGGRISIDAGADVTGEFRFVIADTGIGMAPNDIAKALTPFGHIIKSSSTDIPGTGLGLPFAMRLAQLHGGSLEIQSELNQGTTVRIRLPAHRLAAAPGGSNETVRKSV